jgi:3-oxoadipate CoA-transferase alpha subunit
VQVHEIVELGTLDPEAIVTPGIFVKRMVRVERSTAGSDAGSRAA